MPENNTLVQKWTWTGFLRGIKSQYLQQAAERLEAAQRRCLGTYSLQAYDDTLQAMDRDGYYEPVKSLARNYELLKKNR